MGFSYENKILTEKFLKSRSLPLILFTLQTRKFCVASPANIRNEQVAKEARKCHRL